MLDLPVPPSHERFFARGDTILRQGEATAALFVVRDGIVKLSAVSETGREAALDLLGSGEVFGEHDLFGEPAPSPWRAVVVRPVRATVIPPEALRRALEERPALALGLLQAIETRLRRTAASLQDALMHDATTRVSRRLATLAREHGKPHRDGILVDAPLTQGDLAQLVGSSRETVNKVIADIAARGLIRVQGRRFLIHDPGALERLTPRRAPPAP